MKRDTYFEEVLKNNQVIGDLEGMDVALQREKEIEAIDNQHLDYECESARVLDMCFEPGDILIPQHAQILMHAKHPLEQKNRITNEWSTAKPPFDTFLTYRIPPEYEA